MTTVCMSGIDCKDGVQATWLLSYPFERTDSGRSSSRRQREQNDCTVRAVATAFGLDYDDAYDALAEGGRKCSRGFNLSKWLAVQGIASVQRLSFPAVKGRRRMNPATFCSQYPVGNYICRVAKHVFAVVDGVVHDDQEQRPDRCIYLAWRIM